MDLGTRYNNLNNVKPLVLLKYKRGVLGGLDCTSVLFRKFTFKHAYMAISKTTWPTYDETPKTGFLVTSTLKEIFSKTIKAAHKMFDYHMSLVMRNPGFCICENKDADQLRSNCAADQHLCFRYTDSTISLLPISENSSL